MHNKNQKNACGGTSFSARPFPWRYLHMKILVLSLLLSLSVTANSNSYSNLPYEEKLKYWGIEFEVSYSDGKWIKMACMPIVLKSSLSVDGAEFIGVEVWHHINKGKENAGFSTFF